MNPPRACGTVLVVDDDALLRRLVGEALARGGFETVEAETGEQALRTVDGGGVDAVVLDVHLQDVSGYEVCRELREEGRTIPVLFLSGERTESFDRVAGLLLGADDYMTKPFAPDELLARVRAMLRRAAPPPAQRIGRLTRRELEVLALLADGLTQPEIARTLTISPKTVGTHIEHILEKLGVRSRAQAVALAYREALVPGR